MGRPKKIIDKGIFEELCQIQCTEVEICHVLHVCEDTLNTWCKETYGKTFSETFEQNKAGGRVSLRRLQWKHAEKNPAMAMFLGKNLLGQRDSAAVSINMSVDDDPITKALKESGIISDGLK